VLENLYHDIWIYGLKEMGSPVEGLGLSATTMSRISFTGYLDREIPSDRNWVAPLDLEQPFILVTAGGGGDGVEMVDWVIRAYESGADLPCRAIIVTGPFMQPAEQQEFHERCDALDNVEIITFESHIELLMQKAIAVVAMGGYNTFCEVLSLDKRALIVPRTTPRLEQFIRASRASSLGLVSMLADDGRRDPEMMAAALRALPRRNLPSEVVVPGLLEGLQNVARLVSPWIEGARDEAVEANTFDTSALRRA
jgi:predicted glycosyltransferase